MQTTNVSAGYPIIEDVLNFHLLSETDYEQLFDLVSIDNNNVDETVAQFQETYNNLENIISGGSFEDENQVVFPGQECLPDFDFDFTSILDPDFELNELPGGEGNGNDGEEYTDTPATPSPFQDKRNTKSDRARIINSERKRRGTMKEKLYQLRALVPNITKMDRASIIADAVKYVQDLQMKANKLKTQIENLESSDEGNIHQQKSIYNKNQSKPTQNSISKKIMQIEVVQIEETEFHVRLVCKNGFGVAASLIKALELLSGFTLLNSNLASEAEDYVLRFNIKVSESKEEVNIPKLKSLINTALLSEGFDIEKSLSAAAACSA
ncbi:DNA-binding transcription factor [Lithospermum erythrorhizon]|uniref:DNA-binding transcription factor n=1 Tax=Lithospermum erythrorhizon TaxID=34254 RepID=A0AAV3QGL6_LITER